MKYYNNGLVQFIIIIFHHKVNKKPIDWLLLLFDETI
jgi:hypothetical protein